MLQTSETEIVVLSDKECDADCPYWRPNATSHYGWSGSSKAFFIEFQMDHYPNLGTDQGMLSDAPAYWFLNAAIPRILQYGSDRNNIPCSWLAPAALLMSFAAGVGFAAIKRQHHFSSTLSIAQPTISFLVKVALVVMGDATPGLVNIHD